jgi:hypothetical protein
MSKFKKGDKVVSVKTGAKGVVDEVYGEEKYAVLFDGAANPDRVEGHQIKAAPVSTNSVVRNAMAVRTARNASDADVARYLAAAKDRIRAEVVALKDVAGLLKMEPVPPSAEKAYAKVVKAMASLQKAFAELS